MCAMWSNNSRQKSNWANQLPQLPEALHIISSTPLAFLTDTDYELILFWNIKLQILISQLLARFKNSVGLLLSGRFMPSGVQLCLQPFITDHYEVQTEQSLYFVFVCPENTFSTVVHLDAASPVHIQSSQSKERKHSQHENLFRPCMHITRWDKGMTG